MGVATKTSCRFVVRSSIGGSEFGHILVKVNSTVRELAEGSLLLELSGGLGVLHRE